MRETTQELNLARISNPILFSQEFKIDPKQLIKLGLLDPILTADTKLFIDPVLLESSKHPIIKSKGVAQFVEHYGKVIRLLQHSKVVGDVAWRNSALLLKLDERPELCLGFGGGTTRGRDIPKNTQNAILRTAKEIIELGVKDPELFSLVGLLEEGVGPDTIGDMTANALLPVLVELTSETAKQLGIKTKLQFVDGIEAKLPYNKYSGKPQLLVPNDILRDLPIASDWSDITTAASENQKIRDRVNKFLGNVWMISGKKQKDQLRASALKDQKSFKALMEAAYNLSEDSYDFDADPEGHRIFREALAEVGTKFPLKIKKPTAKTHNELRAIVDVIVEHFKELIETNGINYLLWSGNKPRSEKAAQRLFFAVADVYCRANNLDISPETDSGGGPVDFKFSSGYAGRIVVELKLSTGAVVHGYKTQIKVYSTAAKAFDAIFLIVDVGKMGKKLDTIFDAKNAAAKLGEKTSDIVVVDASIKPSASNR